MIRQAPSSWRPPGNIWEHESDEHNQGNNRAEMVFDIVETLAYRLIDVNHLRACAQENGNAILLEPKEHRSTFSRDNSRKHRFCTDRGTSQNSIFLPQSQREFETGHWSGQISQFIGYAKGKIAVALLGVTNLHPRTETGAHLCKDFARRLRRRKMLPAAKLGGWLLRTV